ncbi:MAG: metallophosphoesterase [Anaerotignaceae bacterium]
MKILVLSDSHNYLENARFVLKSFNYNYVVHLGDNVIDAKDLQEEFPHKEFHFVAGNNDFCSTPYDKEINIGGKKILITHGHIHSILYSFLNLALWGREKEADMVLFGHTHKPYLAKENDIILFNPGSISLPRSSKYPTFGIIEITKTGEIICEAFQVLPKGKVEKMKF